MRKRPGGVAVDFNHQPLPALPGIGPRVAEKIAARGLETVLQNVAQPHTNPSSGE